MRIPERISRILSLQSIIAFQFKFCQKKTYQPRFSNRLQNKAYTIDITSRGRNQKSISHDGNFHIGSARVAFRSLVSRVACLFACLLPVKIEETFGCSVNRLDYALQ
jgi:hypothetical protein